MSVPIDNPYGLERPPFPPSAPARVGIPPPTAPITHAPIQRRKLDALTWVLAIAIAASAAAVIVGIVATSWFSTRGASAGLLGLHACHGDGCVTRTWSDFQAPTDVTLFSAIGLVGALASIVMAAIVTALAFIGKESRIPYRILNGALGVAAFGCTAFMTRLSGEIAKGLSIGYAGFVMFAGLVGLAVAARFLVRR